MAKKLKPIPMPIETVLHSRHLQFVQGGVYRAVIAIACQFWAGGAQLGEFDDAMAAQLSRLPVGNWNSVKAPVMAALADILPELATLYAALYASRQNLRAVLSVNGTKGRAIAIARRKAREGTDSGKQNQAARVPLKTPQIAPRYVNPAACMSPQELAALPQDNVESARFCDK